MRIFLDANVLFAAAKSDGAIRELLLYGRTVHGVTIHSPRSLAEALLA